MTYKKADLFDNLKEKNIFSSLCEGKSILLKSKLEACNRKFVWAQHLFYLTHLRPTYPSYRSQSSDLKRGNLPLNKLQMRTAFIRYEFSLTHMFLVPNKVFLSQENGNVDFSFLSFAILRKMFLKFSEYCKVMTEVFSFSFS